MLISLRNLVGRQVFDPHRRGTVQTGTLIEDAVLKKQSLGKGLGIVWVRRGNAIGLRSGLLPAKPLPSQRESGDDAAVAISGRTRDLPPHPAISEDCQSDKGATQGTYIHTFRYSTV